MKGRLFRIVNKMQKTNYYDMKPVIAQAVFLVDLTFTNWSCIFFSKPPKVQTTRLLCFCSFFIVLVLLHLKDKWGSGWQKWCQTSFCRLSGQIVFSCVFLDWKKVLKTQKNIIKAFYFKKSLYQKSNYTISKV